MTDQDKGEKEQRPHAGAPGRFDRLDSILLKGRVYEDKKGEFITLAVQGALLTVRYEDTHDVREISKDESEILVKSNARITYETLLHPQEVEGILSKELVVEIGRVASEPTECSRCVPTECSRCSGTECSRCSGSILRSAPTECSRCVGTECSRCVGTECSRCVGTECSRCVERTDSPFGGFEGGTFRRRLT